jgi:hypothetical protein
MFTFSPDVLPEVHRSDHDRAQPGQVDGVMPAARYRGVAHVT